MSYTTTRRAFLRDATLLGAGVSSLAIAEAPLPASVAAPKAPAAPAPAPSTPGTVALSWVGEHPPAIARGVSWGVPWPQGAVSKDAPFNLSAGDKPLALQSWPMAYWPDGSLKWSGFATVVPAGNAAPLSLAKGAGSAAGTLSVKNDGKSVLVDTGALQCSIPLHGANIIDSLNVGGKPAGGAAQLVCILQNGPEASAEDTPKREKFLSTIKTVTVEQTGPVRAVVKIDGMHRGVTSKREWLPFSIRLYFYSGQADIRLVHTIIFDGDQEKDFVRGLGLEFDVPLRDEVFNRHVRFGGPDGGLWYEPLQIGGGNVAQETGQRFTANPIFTKNAIWDDFKLIQPNPDGFSIVKRTNPASTWLFSTSGKRAAGFAYVGDLNGGLGVSVKNFWQSFPASLEVQRAASSTAKLVTWLWSPEGPAMDMRFYDTHGHGLDAAYEDSQPGLSTAHGVARTSELTLFAAANWPARQATVDMASAGRELPLLAASPQYVHSTGVFGVWSMPDHSTAFKKSIEDGLDSVLAYYQRQVDDRSWYGYWQYGDFIHSYSAPRHMWHYDWGGHAWDNTELGAPLWLWYSYLRTGRADLFRLAEAHARNTSETDVYHLGPMKGLGTRHNVIKWGCGAKEARISQSAHWRLFYFLTTDERTGDIMRMCTDAAPISVGSYDPMRLASPASPGEPKVRIRIAPDWIALAGNWMTEWERTNDPRWPKLINAGIDSFLAMPFEMMTGKYDRNPKAAAAIVGFDAATGKLTSIPDAETGRYAPVNYNLATIQGGGEVMFELVPLLGRKDLDTAWLRMSRLSHASAEAYTLDKTTNNEGADASLMGAGQSQPRLAAYIYARTQNPAYAAKAVEALLAEGGGIANTHIVSGADSIRPVEEDPRMSTNEAAQTGLSAIQVLEFCKDRLPTAAAVRTVRTRRPPPPVAAPAK